MTDAPPTTGAPPRCGDQVRHRPTGENWVVAWADGENLAWSGWPNGIAKQADCEVTLRCNDADHRKWVAQWVGANDPRAACVAMLYGKVLQDVRDAGATAAHPLHDAANPATSWALNPWVPMSVPIDLKHLGKLAEELNEAGSAVARCVIQGINECEPITHKSNRLWLEDELADVLANIELVTEHFALDAQRMAARVERKKAHLRGWHLMLATDKRA